MGTSTHARSRASALPPEERRTTIIEATIPLLLEHGEAVTTRQIAEATGIAEGTIFRVFADKDAVIAAAIEYELDASTLDPDLAELDADQPLADVLVRATALIQQRVVRVWRLLSAVGPRHHDRSRRPAEESPTLVAIFDRHADELRVDPAAAARTLRSLTLSMTHPLLTADPVDPETIVDLTLHGVATGDRSCS